MSKIVRVERVPEEEPEAPVRADFPNLVDIAAMLGDAVPVKVLMLVERSDGVVTPVCRWWRHACVCRSVGDGQNNDDSGGR